MGENGGFRQALEQTRLGCFRADSRPILRRVFIFVWPEGTMTVDSKAIAQCVKTDAVNADEEGAYLKDMFKGCE